MKRLLLTVLGCMIAPINSAAETTPLLHDLVVTAGFTKKEISRLGDDEVLARELKVTDRSRRAAFAGIVRIKGDGSGLANTAEELDLNSVPGAVDAFGRFSAPPKPADVASLKFSDGDLEVLADCQIQSCKFKSSREGIEALSEIDWDAPGAGQAFTDLFRREVVAYVQRYSKEGSGALIVYEDKSSPVSIADTVSSLMKQFPAFQRHAPKLAGHLLGYPENRSASLTDSIVWSVKNFGYRPTVTVDHIIADRQPEISGAAALVAVKTIYANHYLAGRVQLGAVVDGAVALGIPGNFILLVDQIQFDDKLSGFKRSLLGRGLRSDVEDRMKLLGAMADDGR